MSYKLVESKVQVQSWNPYMEPGALYRIHGGFQGSRQKGKKNKMDKNKWATDWIGACYI